jgi:uncharacterized protein
MAGQDRSTSGHATAHDDMVAIIKPIGDFCNLRCTYCFYHGLDQATPVRMNDRLLEKLIIECLNGLGRPVQFVWHGGEPLLAGLPFYERAVELQERHAPSGAVFRNVVQTNGTLLNDEWAEFFRRHTFRVGVSIDGGRASHDAYRTRRNGRGSFDQVVAGIQGLRDRGIEPGFIHTIKRGSVGRAAEDFAFFADELGARSWGLNAYIADTQPQKDGMCHTIEDDELTAYLEAYLALWLERGSDALCVREIENAVAAAVGSTPYNCSYNGTCSRFFCVDYNGDVYPCDRSSHRPDLLLGNLTGQPLREILSSARRQSYERELACLPADCQACEWRDACNNGCTMQRSGGISGRFYHCATRKTFFASVANAVGEQWGGHVQGEEGWRTIQR